MMPPIQDAMSTSLESSGSQKNGGMGKLLLGLSIGLGIAAFFYFDLSRFLSLEGLKSNRDQLLAFAEGHYSAAVVIFVIAYCVIVGLSLPGGSFMTLAGGFLFGCVFGTVYVYLVATV